MKTRKSAPRIRRPKKDGLKTRILIAFIIGTIAVVALGAAPSLVRRVQAARNRTTTGMSQTISSPQKSTINEKGERSPDGIWQVTGTNTLAKAQASQAGLLAKYRSLELNRDGLTAVLDSAPLEGSSEASGNNVVMTLPMPDGTFGRFKIVESPMLEDALAARHPELKTYQAVGLDDRSASARFSWTPNGFEAIVLSPEGTAFVQPATQGQATSYLSYYAKDVSADSVLFRCGATGAFVKDAELRDALSAASSGNVGTAALPTSGSTLRTYRLAVAATAEFTQQFGPDVNTALAKITSIINQVNAIYLRDLAIKFTLVNGETQIIFTDTNADGYTNGTPNSLLTENQTKLDAVIGAGNYDIGHVFGGIDTGSANSFSFSGIAAIGAVCRNGVKARGVSTFGGTNSVFTPFIVVGVSHEIGHEFSAFHSYNATLNNACSGQRSDQDAYEPGSGSTIMGYSICNDANGTENLQRINDTYFHAHSIDQILSYATSTGTCSTNTNSGNNAPTVGGPQTYTIPANTPFALTATASDPNAGQTLTYDWEEYDPAGAHPGPPDTDDGFRPIFRSYQPMVSPTRYFPSLKYILNNANVPPTTYVDATPPFFSKTFLTGESMPTTNRTMNFRVTVRDAPYSNAGAMAGAIATGSATINVVNTGSAFNIVSPNTSGVIWAGGTQQTVNWNVAGTNTGQINAATVKISLSTDGGQTFPIILANNVPNNGAATVMLPTINSGSNQGRVKVEAVGNIFFDISDANFTVNAGIFQMCSYQLSASNQNVVAAGGTGSVNVNSPGGCAWSAVSNSSFITITGGSSGSGNGSVTFSVDANHGAQRTGTITIGGQTFTVTQDAATGGATTTIQFSSATFSGSETSGQALVTINRTGDLSGTATVKYLTNDGTANQLTDYELASGILTFAPNETSKTITVLINEDFYVDPNETFSVALNSPNGAFLGAQSTATVTITDDDTATAIAPAPKLFYAVMDRNKVVPPTSSSTRALATLLLSQDETTAKVSFFTVTDLTSPEMSAHIHGPSDGNNTAPVLFNLPSGGKLSEFTINLTPTQVSQLKSGQFYIDVHSQTFPNGEIRGQFLVNAADDSANFVLQHYYDFMARVPDAPGLAYWTSQITQCNSDAQCLKEKRDDVSNSFFFEPEFQITGAFVYRVYKVAYAQSPTYAQFVPDRASINSDAAVIEASKLQLTTDFVQRPEFTAQYLLTWTPAQFVDKLNTNIGNAMTQTERDGYVNGLINGTETRGSVLKKVADSQAVVDREYNNAFVTTEYFGYLRRDPDAGGFQFWLGQMNRYPIRTVSIQHALVCSFITSAEYQLRFGPVVSQSNAECPQ